MFKSSFLCKDTHSFTSDKALDGKSPSSISSVCMSIKPTYSPYIDGYAADYARFA
jgi:hypothetical protein